ncbi:MAG: hypothetical protein ABI442_11750, partial [Gemmatimonadaceae bacterium]
ALLSLLSFAAFAAFAVVVVVVVPAVIPWCSVDSADSAAKRDALLSQRPRLPGAPTRPAFRAIRRDLSEIRGYPHRQRIANPA